MKEIIRDLYENIYDQSLHRVKNRVGGLINAEDVVQEAFTRALTYANSFNERIASVGGWFNTILNNAAKDFKREERLSGMSTTDEELGEPADTTAYNNEMVEKVLEGMDESPYREILRLYFLLGYTPADIAKVTDQRPQSISNAVQRFKNEMRERYPEV
jgi:RNA polymerase sigma factor (sigma-70 family)